MSCVSVKYERGWVERLTLQAIQQTRSERLDVLFREWLELVLLEEIENTLPVKRSDQADMIPPIESV